MHEQSIVAANLFAGSVFGTHQHWKIAESLIEKISCNVMFQTGALTETNI